MGQFNYTGIKSVFARSVLGVRAPARVLVYLCVRVYRLFGVNLEFVCRARVLSTSDPPREEFMRLIHIGIVSDEFFLLLLLLCTVAPFQKPSCAMAVWTLCPSSQSTKCPGQSSDSPVAEYYYYCCMRRHF